MKEKEKENEDYRNKECTGSNRTLFTGNNHRGPGIYFRPDTNQSGFRPD
jgi:hypothetical protein